MWSANQGPLALDLDGTLIDARRRQLTVLARVLAELELPPIVPDLFWERKRGGESTAQALIGPDLDGGRANDVARRWVERVEDEDELLADLLLPGVEDTLTALDAAGVRPTVVTARTYPDRAHRQFAALGLNHWCEGPKVVAQDGATERKAAVLRNLGATGYVGDSESDARAAALAKVPFAAVATGQRSPAFLTAQGLDPHPVLAVAIRSLRGSGW